LLINGEIIKYYTKGNLFKGQFIFDTFDTKELDNIFNGAFSCVVGAGDNIFNFKHSLDMMLNP